MPKQNITADTVPMEGAKGEKDGQRLFYATTVDANDFPPLERMDRKKSIDEAYDFLQNVSDQEAAGVDLKRLRRRIDWHIVPIMFALFGLQFLDKFLLNYAIIMGLPEDLKLQGNELNNIASSLWWAYLISSAAVGLILNKVPLGKWLGVSMFLWGIVIACTAAVKGYSGMMAIRICMGVFDAGIPPALMLISSQYYRKDEQTIRYAYWFSSVGICLILGGLISYGFQFVHSETLAGWRIMFLTLGLVSVSVGLWTFFYMPDTPMNATFLNDVEKKAILQYVAVNQTGISSNKIQWRQLKSVFSDVQVWLLLLNVTFISAGSGILTTYGATLIKSFGYDSKHAALLQTPAGAISFTFTILAAVAVRHHIMQRWAVSMIGYCLALLGACLIAFAPRSDKGAMLTGIYLVSFSIPTVAIKYQWVSANVGGYTKRTCTMALMSGAFSIGNIIAPYAVQRTDAPEFHTAKVVLVSTKAAATGVVALLVLYYVWANRRRDKTYGKPPPVDDALAGMDAELWKNETDKEKERTFRYVY